jgi:cytochrome c oxidase subunit 2
VAGRGAILILGVAMTAVGCGASAKVEPQDGGDRTPSPTVPGARQIQVKAEGFRFDPDELHLRAGESVNVSLLAEDSVHDFTIDGIVHVSAKGGEVWSGGLRIDDRGRYVLYCSVLGHKARGMKGTLIVDKPAIVPIPDAPSTSSAVSGPPDDGPRA